MRPCRCAHVRSRPRRPGTLVGPASGEVLSLDIEKLDLANRQAPVVVKGGDTRWITWGTDTARLLPRLIAGRQRGPPNAQADPRRYTE